MLFHSLEDGNSSAYFVQIVTPVYGELDAALMIESFERLVQRHDVFRTTFLYDNLKQPLQIVLIERPASIVIEKLDDSNDEMKHERIGQFLQKDREAGFHLTTDPLIRLALLQTAGSEWVIVLSFHHILMDGWCSDLVFNELFHMYASLKERIAVELPPPAPYSQYIKWLENQDKEAAGRYWKTCLDRCEQSARLPWLKKKETSLPYTPMEYSFSFGREATGQLAWIAKQNQVTLNAIFQAIWGLILQKYNDQTDVVFGSVVTARPAAIRGMEQMIGLFINTLPVRVQTQANQSFQSLMRQMHEQTVKSYEFAYFPLSRIQREAVGGSQIFDHILVFDHHPVEQQWEQISTGLGLQVGEQKVIEHTNYDVSITAALKNDELTVTFIYNSNVIHEKEIKRISTHIVNVANCVRDDISIPVRKISLTSSAEIQGLLRSNMTKTNHTKDQTIADLFEKQVCETPKHTALIFAGQTLTYEKLNRKANQLAHLLQGKGAEPDCLVGLMAERSMEMVIGIIGILKSNGAYVPMDPDNPVHRLRMILDDSKVPIVLVQRSALPKLKEVLQHTEGKEEIEYCVIEDALRETKPDMLVNPVRTCAPHHLGYVMYTSGSTGRPKGILTQQNNIIRVVKDTNYITINPEDTLLQLSSFSFDGSAFDIFGPLLNGAALVLVRQEALLEMNMLLQIIADEEVSVFFTTTALFNTLVDVDMKSLAKVRKVLFGGERVSLLHVKKAFEYMGKGKILHMYGPTESTVYAAYHEVNAIDESLGTVPIGVPLSNTEILILSKENHLQPVGVIGELCIAGDGLARGYLNNEVLTQEKFAAHPFNPEERMYRTGDLARWLEDGTIEFVGRADHQVKLRGFRIELGEIEYRLLSHEAVKEAVVVDCQDPSGGKTLCAYYVAHRNISSAELRERLSESLPYYMIPSYFVRMEAWPLNSNGKVEKKRLPLPDWNADHGNGFEPPHGELEEQLAEVWQDVLGIGNIGIFDNYYELGGDSIKAIQICARLRDHQLNLSVTDLLKNPTIKELKRRIRLLNPNKENELSDSDYSGISIDELSDLEEDLRASIDQG
ncbi:amino acid adenylation domain-containing protein [Paenibacillus apiarius]|nr:amino acid adenylation domain-containing protein [Paenibacillus apiarius]